MNVICIIPARGGSKRVPGKNILPLAGLPVLAWSIVHARNAKGIDTVVVSTDDEAIADVARTYGAEVIMRPPELANDTATSESALEHALETWCAAGKDDPELVVFLQCTSPARRIDDIDNAILQLRESNADAVFSGTPQRGFVWGVDTDGTPQSLTYDWQQRKRGQDMDPRFVENGSIYVFRPDLLRKTSNRLGGRIGIYEMDYWSSFEIDTPEDMELLEWILRRPEYTTPITWPRPIDLLVFDFDGVMTDNTASVDEQGNETVRIDRADGLGIDQMHAVGMPMLILSTERNPVVTARAQKLQIDVEHGIADKAKRLAEIIAERDLDPDRVIYLGNDVNDLGCFALVGFPVAVADAHPQVRSAANHVLSKNGGNGAVRELCDLVTHHMKQQKAEQS